MSGRYRPEYERPEDRAEEAAVCKELEEKGLQFEKLPPKDVIDFAVLKEGKVVGFMEVKARSNASDHYPTFMISMAKFLRIKQILDSTGIPTALVVKYTDKVRRLWIAKDTLHFVEMGGRHDRGDGEDVEPVVHFKTDLFTDLWEVKQ